MFYSATIAVGFLFTLNTFPTLRRLIMNKTDGRRQNERVRMRMRSVYYDLLRARQSERTRQTKSKKKKDATTETNRLHLVAVDEMTSHYRHIVGVGRR